MYSINAYRKTSIKEFWTTQREFIRKGGSFKNLDENDAYDSFIGLLRHILRANSTYNLTSQIHIFGRVYHKLYENFHANIFKLNEIGNLCTSWILICLWGLIERGII